MSFKFASGSRAPIGDGQYKRQEADPFAEGLFTCCPGFGPAVPTWLHHRGKGFPRFKLAEGFRVAKDGRTSGFNSSAQAIRKNVDIYQ